MGEVSASKCDGRGHLMMPSAVSAEALGGLRA